MADTGRFSNVKGDTCTGSGCGAGKLGSNVM